MRTSINFAAIAKALMVPVTAAVLAIMPTYGHEPWFIAVIAVLGVLGIYSPSAVNAGTPSIEARLRILENWRTGTFGPAQPARPPLPPSSTLPPRT